MLKQNAFTRWAPPLKLLALAAVLFFFAALPAVGAASAFIGAEKLFVNQPASLSDIHVNPTYLTPCAAGEPGNGGSTIYKNTERACVTLTYEVVSDSQSITLETGKTAAALFEARLYDAEGSLLEKTTFQENPHCFQPGVIPNQKRVRCYAYVYFDAAAFPSAEQFYEVETAVYDWKLTAEQSPLDETKKFVGADETKTPYSITPKLAIFVTEADCKNCGNGDPNACSSAGCAKRGTQTVACVYKSMPGISSVPCAPETYFSSEAPVVAKAKAEIEKYEVSQAPQDEEERRQRAIALLELEEQTLEDFKRSKDALYNGKEYTVNAIVRWSREKGKKEFTLDEINKRLTGTQILLGWLKDGEKYVATAMNDWNAQKVKEERDAALKRIDENERQAEEIWGTGSGGDANAGQANGGETASAVGDGNNAENQFTQTFSPGAPLKLHSLFDASSSGFAVSSTTRQDSETRGLDNARQEADKSRTAVKKTFSNTEALVQETAETPIVKMLFEKEKLLQQRISEYGKDSDKATVSEADEAELMIKEASKAEKLYDYALSYHYYSLAAGLYALPTAKEKASEMFDEIRPPGLMNAWWWKCLSPLTDVRFLPLMIIPGTQSGRFVQLMVNAYFIAAGTEGLVNAVSEARRDGNWKQMTIQQQTNFGLEVGCSTAMIAVGVIGGIKEGIKLGKELRPGTAPETGAVVEKPATENPAVEKPAIAEEPKTNVETGKETQTVTEPEVKAAKLSSQDDASAAGARSASQPGIEEVIKQNTERTRGSLDKFLDAKCKDPAERALIKKLFDDAFLEELRKKKNAELTEALKSGGTGAQKVWTQKLDAALDALKEQLPGVVGETGRGKIPEVIAKIREIVLYQDAKTSGTAPTNHGLAHVLIDLEYAIAIYDKLKPAGISPQVEAAEKAALAIATLLHDTGYTQEVMLTNFKLTKAHPQISARYLEVLLPELKELLADRPDVYDQIYKAIDEHQTSMIDLKRDRVGSALSIADELPVDRTTALSQSPTALEIMYACKVTKKPVQELATPQKIDQIRTELGDAGYGEFGIDQAVEALKGVNDGTFDLHYMTLGFEYVGTPVIDVAANSIELPISITKDGVMGMERAGTTQKGTPMKLAYLSKLVEALAERLGGKITIIADERTAALLGLKVGANTPAEVFGTNLPSSVQTSGGNGINTNIVLQFAGETSKHAPLLAWCCTTH